MEKAAIIIFIILTTIGLLASIFKHGEQSDLNKHNGSTWFSYTFILCLYYVAGIFDNGLNVANVTCAFIVIYGLFYETAIDTEPFTFNFWKSVRTTVLQFAILYYAGFFAAFGWAPK